MLLFAISISNGFSQQKNVVFIIVDDLKPLLGSFEQKQIHSPNIDSLAAKSAIFTNAHTQQAICGPSRISLLTGMRPDYTKVYDLKTYMREMNPNILTLPEHFKNSEYQTVGMGKVFHMAKRDDPQSWTLPFIDERDLTYPEEFGAPVMKHYQLPAMKEQVANFNEEDVDFDRDDLIKMGIHPSSECLDIPDNAYADGAMAIKSIELLNTFKNDEKPFFMTIGFHRPHLPFVAPKKYWDLYDRNTIEVAAYQKIAENSPSYAYHKSGELHNYSDIPADMDLKNPLEMDKQRELIHGYYASVSYVDAQIGMVLDHLKTAGLAENTVVVLVGDHGWHLGDHGLWNKHTNFEQATRTPLIVFSPEMTNSTSIDAPTELVDVFPTMCDYAGISIPEHLHGQSLRPLISGEVSTLKPVAISQYPRNNLMGYTARSDRYRYTEWHKKGGIQEGIYEAKDIKDKELYDYVKDPLETKNLIDDPAYKEVVKEMRGYMKERLVKETK